MQTLSLHACACGIPHLAVSKQNCKTVVRELAHPTAPLIPAKCYQTADCPLSAAIVSCHCQLPLSAAGRNITSRNGTGRLADAAAKCTERQDSAESLVSGHDFVPLFSFFS